MSERKSSILHPRSNFTKNPCYTFHHSAPVTTLSPYSVATATRQFRMLVPSPEETRGLSPRDGACDSVPKYRTHDMPHCSRFLKSRALPNGTTLRHSRTLGPRPS